MQHTSAKHNSFLCLLLYYLKMASSLQLILILTLSSHLIVYEGNAATCSNCFLHSQAVYYPDSDQHGTESKNLGTICYLHQYLCMTKYIFHLRLQLELADLVNTEQQSTTDMYQLHLISIEEALVVVPAIRSASTQLNLDHNIWHVN